MYWGENKVPRAALFRSALVQWSLSFHRLGSSIYAPRVREREGKKIGVTGEGSFEVNNRCKSIRIEI
jgi:hypothetical protein